MRAARLGGATALLAVAWLVALAGPAAADNCDLRINPEDCQNTAWTVGTVATVAAAATAAAVAAGAAAAGATTAAPPETDGPTDGEEPAEGEPPAEEVPPEPEGPVTTILSGDRAMEVLEEMGLVQSERMPDGTIRYTPTGDFDDLNTRGATSFEELSTASDPTTGKVTGVQEATITRIGGIAWNEQPDGSIRSATIIVERSAPTPWQEVNELAPGIRAQGPADFVQSATDAYNTMTSTASGQAIAGDIGSTGHQVRIRPVSGPNAGNYEQARLFGRGLQRPDGTRGLGSGSDIYWNPNRTRAGDGSQPWHNRPADVGLVHEFCHARDDAMGNTARGVSPDPAMPRGTRNRRPWEINDYELQATSIGAYANNPSDENSYRTERSLAHRDSYVL